VNLRSWGTLPKPPLGYSVRDYNAETGLRYYRARYYDPGTGRFIGEDPVLFLGGLDFYGYVKNSPVNLVDLFGLADKKPNLPTTPTGKAGCQFLFELDSPGLCKQCVHKCRGYGALVVFPQAKGAPCPSIDPISSLVITDEILPPCRPNQDENCSKKKQTMPQQDSVPKQQAVPKHFNWKLFWYSIFTGPIE
jgi:RHS repeat-associated protein